ncbi:MAG TPA: LPXTG cell wall anchor domain-containing protein [Kouleothrix sp.]|uniref:LPXTG cell wall anchor domain-containing protein n=1 Tax=Kouleothrix sp. TaxID=2779161 RepID=UPI002BA6609F|nr:LPXTG cell wall anchor domain-containing protein [Kouleothrix sp.]HRC74243.1 LPXTG cell wall anchor domain-containing protein [Kouleothrix sp.]
MRTLAALGTLFAGAILIVLMMAPVVSAANVARPALQTTETAVGTAAPTTAATAAATTAATADATAVATTAATAAATTTAATATTTAPGTLPNTGDDSGFNPIWLAALALVIVAVAAGMVVSSRRSARL